MFGISWLFQDLRQGFKSGEKKLISRENNSAKSHKNGCEKLSEKKVGKPVSPTHYTLALPALFNKPYKYLFGD